MIKDPMVAPKDYDDFYRQYDRYIRAILIQQGLPKAQSEDLMHDLMLRFMERDILSMFDADYVTERKGVQHRARFQTFVNGLVYTYVMGLRQRVARDARREVAVLDQPLASTDGATSGTGSMLDLLVTGAEPSAEETYMTPQAGILEAELMEHLSKIKMKVSHLRTDLQDVTYDQVLRVIMENQDRVVRDSLMKEYSISSGTAYTWMKRVRDAAQDFLGNLE